MANNQAVSGEHAPSVARDLLDLMICRIPGLRGKEKIELEKRFDNEEDFSVLSRQDIEQLVGRTIIGRNWKMSEIRFLAEKDAAISAKLGIHTVSWRQETYPPLLREIFDPPVLLFYRGVLPDPGKPMVAVVGTRKPTSAAVARAFALGRELGEAGINVVSGLALGIDAMAHRGNIEGRAHTVAVLGSSPDLVYPASNRELARRILETGGLILSEYPPGTRPLKWHFPERNRIISALARGTVIVEAPEKSGALITARFAIEQDRDLWVDRVGVSSKLGGRTARLAEEGAGL
ncbi:MAG: DNA-processing protein DprA, partial [Treponema sp.]|nr:DNA-processing protein DprA [Treponema sp.]